MIVSQLQFAVSLMVAGRYDEATMTLDHLLVQLRKYFFAHETLAETKRPVATVEAFLGPRCSAHRSIVNTAQAMEYPIYERVMLIRGVDDHSAWANEMDVAVITSVVLFNKGLIFHIIGQRFGAGKNTELNMARAKVLYEKACHLIRTCSSSVDQNFWIKLVLVNNLGQICSSLCDRSGEQACLVYIDQLLTHRYKQEGCGYDEKELQLNVMLLLGAYRPSPAA